MSDRILCLARIKQSKGLKGHLKATTFGDFLLESDIEDIELYSSQGPLDGFLKNAKWIKSLELDELKKVKPGLLEIKLISVDSIEDAEKLRGLFIGIELEQARKLAESLGETYLFEYTDCKLIDKATGFEIGLRRVQDLNGKTWLIVDYKEKELMVPIELANLEKEKKIIEVENLEELLESQIA